MSMDIDDSVFRRLTNLQHAVKRLRRTNPVMYERCVDLVEEIWARSPKEPAIGFEDSVVRLMSDMMRKRPLHDAGGAGK